MCCPLLLLFRISLQLCFGSNFRRRAFVQIAWNSSTLWKWFFVRPGCRCNKPACVISRGPAQVQKQSPETLRTVQGDSLYLELPSCQATTETFRGQSYRKFHGGICGITVGVIRKDLFFTTAKTPNPQTCTHSEVLLGAADHSQ